MKLLCWEVYSLYIPSNMCVVICIIKIYESQSNLWLMT